VVFRFSFFQAQCLLNKVCGEWSLLFSMAVGKRSHLFVLSVSCVIVLWWCLFSGREPVGGSFERGQIAVVVLGQQLHSDQMPRMGLKRRVLHAADLWRRFPSALVILSGARKSEVDERSPGKVYTEASAMREIALCAGEGPKKKRDVNILMFLFLFKEYPALVYGWSNELQTRWKMQCMQCCFCKSSLISAMWARLWL
jgi:hypothetical protein